MPFVRDADLDAKLNNISTDATRLDICSAEPTTYAEATSTFTLANHTLVGGDKAVADNDGAGGGRMLTVAAQTIPGADVTASGTPAAWALTNGVDTLVATGTGSGPDTTAGFDYDVAAFSIRSPDATTT